MWLKSLSFANRAFDVDVGEEVHLYLRNTFPPAGFTPATPHIETEPARPVSLHPGLRHLREDLPDGAEEAGVCSRIGSRGSADR